MTLDQVVKITFDQVVKMTSGQIVKMTFGQVVKMTTCEVTKMTFRQAVSHSLPTAVLSRTFSDPDDLLLLRNVTSVSKSLLISQDLLLSGFYLSDLLMTSCCSAHHIPKPHLW